MAKVELPHMELESDQELIERIQERDATAFETLFARYSEAIRRHAARMVRDENAAEDIVQEVFLRVWTCAEQWDNQGEFRAWLFTIARNLALNHLRTVQRRRQQSLEIPADEIDEEDESPIPSWLIDTASLGPDAMLEQVEQYELLRRLVDELPEEKREAIRLFYETEMGIREIAFTLGIAEGTVKSRLHYATKRLAQKWKEIAIEWEDL